jgi:predicted  nucleic acid-binding Zn-ribbon protein
MMNRKTYTTSVNGITCNLRLTIKGQLNLKKKYKENAVATIFNAIDDVERQIDVITEALNYAGNENEIKSGEEFLDAFVDDEHYGQEEIAKVLASIAKISGLINDKQYDAIVKYVAEATEEVFAEFDEESKNAKKPAKK